MKLIICIIIGFVVSCILLWLLTEKWLKTGLQPVAEGKYTYAIVLGAKVKGDVPSLSLQYRMEAARDYALQYEHVKLVLSGGQGPGEAISEAEAMRRYFIAHGITASRAIIENQSTSTYENIFLSLKQIGSNIDGVTIISSDYHLTRVKWIVKQMGLKVDVVSASTPQIVRFKLRTRERLALLQMKLAPKNHS